MSYAITSPFPSFNDTDGSPLNNGNVYVGSANLNPVTDPIPVYWDEALTQPAAQPVRTINGYFSRNGSPGRLYTGFVTYSIRVTNNKGVQVFSDLNYKDPSSNAGSTYQQVITAISGQTVFNLSRTYIPGTNNLFVYRNGLRLIVGQDYAETGYSQITLTAGADNGDEFVFDIGYNYDTAANIDAQDVTYKLPDSSSVFTNVEAKLAETVSVKDFGAVGNGIVDDTAAFTAALAANSAILVPTGTYKITSTVSGAGKYMIMYGSLTGTGSISGIGLISEKNTINKTINHLVNWNVDALSREQYDSILLKRNYEGVANANSYYSGGSGIYSYLGYGQDRAAQAQKASGTTNAITAHINVWGAGNGLGTGRTEIVPVAGAAILSRDNIQSGINIYNEFTTIGPKSSNTADREGFLSGITSLVMKFCPGNTIDSAHSGSYGATITTRPGDPGFSFESRVSDTTYPLRAGLSINGWSGLLATATTGYDAAATDGYEFGILIGGVAGSVWLEPTVRSRIGVGIGITDYINFGIDIFTKHPNAVSNSGALRVTPDAGVSLFGLTTQLDSEARIQTTVSSQFGSAIRVGPSTHVTSERAGIQFGDWVLGQDSQGNGTKDFSFYDGSAGRIIFGAPSATNLITLPNLPTSSTGLSTGQIWRNGNTLQIV